MTMLQSRLRPQVFPEGVLELMKPGCYYGAHAIVEIYRQRGILVERWSVKSALAVLERSGKITRRRDGAFTRTPS